MLLSYDMGFERLDCENLVELFTQDTQTNQYLVLLSEKDTHRAKDLNLYPIKVVLLPRGGGGGGGGLCQTDQRPVFKR